MTAVDTQFAPAEEFDPPKRRGKKVLVVILGVLLALAGSAAAAWFLFFAPEKEPEEREDGVVVAFEPLTTTTGHSGLRHARVAMAVVLYEGEDREVISDQRPLLEDQLLAEVSRMDADHIRSEEGSEELRRNLSEEARSIWGDDVVSRVVLTELMVQ